ncbi:MAG TPA: DUF1343 domain-containing protein [Chloroflexota bacterium]|nr:DUF1343 domain-containing protein [Chloroflexota bacterium]
MRLRRRAFGVSLALTLGGAACGPGRSPAAPTTTAPPPTPTVAAMTPAAVPATPVAPTATIAVASPTPVVKPTAASEQIRPGIDVLLAERLDLLAGKRVGLVTNPTGRTVAGVSDVDALFNHPDVKLTALFGPEHGLRGNAQDGVKIDSTTDQQTGLPIYSLYGDTKRPTKAMLQNVDVLVFDIQDVGARFYTFASTMAYVMQAAAAEKKPVIILDRPNPITDDGVEGPVLEPGQESFTGLYPIPVRHGMTMGELARLFNDAFGIHADLTVVPVAGWRRGVWYDQTAIPWVRPSPNIPDLATATVYPGVGLIEATNIAEGRGTPTPFLNVGAPWLDGDRWASALNDLKLPGVRFAPTRFTPASNKFQDQACGGVKIEVTDRAAFQAVTTGLSLITTARPLSGGKFAWDDGFRLMIGNTWVQQRVAAGVPATEIAKAWEPGLKEFLPRREKYLLYPA